jgi:hypothetical protein
MGLFQILFFSKLEENQLSSAQMKTMPSIGTAIVQKPGRAVIQAIFIKVIVATDLYRP